MPQPIPAKKKPARKAAAKKKPPAVEVPDPLRPLGEAGLDVWRRLLAGGRAGSADLELLQLIAEATDEHDSLRARVLAEGDWHERNQLRRLEDHLASLLDRLGVGTSVSTTPGRRHRLAARKTVTGAKERGVPVAPSIEAALLGVAEAWDMEEAGDPEEMDATAVNGYARQVRELTAAIIGSTSPNATPPPDDDPFDQLARQLSSALGDPTSA